jgi:hypothetical protein
MFVFDRSALAVLVPLAMLAGVAIWSSRAETRTVEPQTARQSDVAHRDQAVAANLPSR